VWQVFPNRFACGLPLLALTHVRVTLLPDPDVDEPGKGLREQSCAAKRRMLSESEQKHSSRASKRRIRVRAALGKQARGRLWWYNITRIGSSNRSVMGKYRGRSSVVVCYWKVDAGDAIKCQRARHEQLAGGTGGSNLLAQGQSYDDQSTKLATRMGKMGVAMQSGRRAVSLGWCSVYR
jgi:hypothetical protein